jgi:hypothetical protein
MTQSLRGIPKRRRRDIFVETHRQEFQAPSGATSSHYAAPDGAFSFCKLTFYNYPAPDGALLLVADPRFIPSTSGAFPVVFDPYSI